MTLPPVFANMDRFGFVHHRALNVADKFHAAREMAPERPDFVHILEGDLCWYVDGDRQEFYFHHPKLLTDTLKPADLDQAKEAGTLLTLADVLEADQPHLRYIIEMKNGVGELPVVLKEVIGRLQEAVPERYWFDGFSLRHLQAVKDVDSRAATSLHSKFVSGGWVMRSVPEFFPLSWHRLKNLSYVDAITLTYKTSFANWFRSLGATIDGTCRGVHDAGKVLILGGLTSPETFALARQSRAKAGYAKFPLADIPVPS